MGWLFRCDPSWTAKDQMDDLERQLRESKYSDLIMTRRSFGRFWALLRDKETGHDRIFLALVKGPTTRSGAGYKDMDETWGPYEVDCPLSILDNARAPENEHAYEWRQKVRAYHAAKRERAMRIKPGVWVEYGGHRYHLDRKRIGRVSGGWDVHDMHGNTYRMKTSQLAQAKIVEAPNA